MKVEVDGKEISTTDTGFLTNLEDWNEDIAKVIAPKAKIKLVGIRPGEKLHEQMISSEDSYSTFEYSDYYKILPQINEWKKDKLRIKKGNIVPEGFVYNSKNNKEWMTKPQLKKWIDLNLIKIGKF